MTVDVRCTGHCCKKFMLPLFPEALKSAYLNFIDGGKRTVVDIYGKEFLLPVNQIEIIYRMVIYLGASSFAPDGERFSGVLMPLYACKHFDHDDKKCLIYDDRPDMCRYYPGTFVCRYDGCTLFGRKNLDVFLSRHMIQHTQTK